MTSRFPPIDPSAELALVEQARGSAQEREEALGELFRRYRDPVLTLCLQIVGDRGDAEDVVQQVFLAVHGALPKFRGESRLSTWIYRIALRAAIAARARRATFEPIDLHERTEGPSAEQELLLRDEARRVATAMDRLSVEHRAVLSLFALEGLSHREIADILGVPEGTIWSRLSIARKKLIGELSLQRR